MTGNGGPSESKRAQVAGDARSRAKDETPNAGPHAKPELTDEERTPGAGTLPDADEGTVGDGASS